MNWPRNLAFRVGRRGVGLLVFALLDFAIAWGLVSSPRPPYRAQAAILPLDVWAGIWLTVGIILVAGAFSLRDAYAFAAGVMIKLAWGTATLYGWLVYHEPRGWLGAAIWYAFAALIYRDSQWEENYVSHTPRKGGI